MSRIRGCLSITNMARPAPALKLDPETEQLAQQSRRAEPAVAASPTWWTIEAGAKGEPARINLFGQIGGGWFDDGVQAADFIEELNSITASKIDLHVNSPGGVVFDGIAIMNAIAQHSAQVTAYIDGMAASAASFLVQAADKIVMSRQSRMMIHDAAGICVGNTADMTAMAEVLDALSNDIADVYAEASGKSRALWRDRMRAETWYGAQEAVDAGLADECAPARMPRKMAEEDSIERDLGPVAQADEAAGDARDADPVVDNPASEAENEIDDLDADTLTAALRDSFSLLRGDYSADNADEFRLGLALVADNMPAPRTMGPGDSEAEQDNEERDQDRDGPVVDPTDFYNSVREALIP